jgi:hypothetical protein
MRPAKCVRIGSDGDGGSVVATADGVVPPGSGGGVDLSEPAGAPAQAAAIRTESNDVATLRPGSAPRRLTVTEPRSCSPSLPRHFSNARRD